MGPDSSSSHVDTIRHIHLSYDYADSDNTALNLILTLRPEWRDTRATIEFVRFTDGITNTVHFSEPVQSRIPTNALLPSF